MRTAAYTRYSSRMQRESSLEDQLRNIRSRCAREGWPEPTVYPDAAISGTRSDRPGYRAMLDAANRREFDVLLIDDLSRLSRDNDDTGKAIKRLTFAGIRVVGVSDGTDTAREGHELDTGIRAVIGEHYWRDLAKKTHRGLTGRALSGASAGGLPYGYRVTDVGQRAIHDAQAIVVRRIYADYLAGLSPRAIAAALNREGIKPPRGCSWSTSAIYGDSKRDIGILANPIYSGRQIWNRSQWIKHPDTRRRIRKERPQSEWIVNERPELAIIDAPTWHASQARRQRFAATARGNGQGRAAAHLLSGILRCHECGGPYTMVNHYQYACGRHKDRGDTVCKNRIRVPRETTETAILATIRDNLLTDAAWRIAERAIAAALKTRTPNLDHLKAKVAAAERVHTNVLSAIRAGILTPSTKAELISAERDIETAKAELEAAKRFQPTQILPRAREQWRRIASDLETIRDVPKAREALRELVGERIVLRPGDGAMVAELGAESEINVVAGECFGQYLTEAFHVRIPMKRRAG